MLNKYPLWKYLLVLSVLLLGLFYAAPNLYKPDSALQITGESSAQLIDEKIVRIKKQLKSVVRTRQLHRQSRTKVPYPIVAIVGYTNAGKSTLFNKLTGANVLAQDQVFATLDPTLRQLNLPQGTRAILSDTVGFVSDLPTHLVAAFRATLEEVVEAELIIHVRDIADPDTQAQAQDVYSILAQLGIDEEGHDKVVEVWNKIDLLDEQTLDAIRATRSGDDAALLISAQSGQGTDELLELIESRLAGSDNVLEFQLPLSSMGQLTWIYDNTHVIERTDEEDGSVRMKVRATPDVKSALRARLA